MKGLDKFKDISGSLFLIALIAFAFISLGIPLTIFLLSKEYGFIEISEEVTLLSFLQHLGPIGDFLAGTTVLFLTFAGFLLLIFTTIIQKQELDLTRN